ncbi:MAG: hypothetical protein NUV51_03710 [Sulfuricaulis sp.]|nr:hypothetical protein [Sulfuricaulis sp.]
MATETPDQYWTRILRNYVRGFDAQSPAGSAMLALCVSTAAAGKPCGAWHAAAAVTGTVCHCVPCRKARGQQPVQL